MKNAKQAVREILKQVPEDSSLEDIQYHIYVQEKVNRGLDDVKRGRIVKQKDIEKRMSRWLGK